MLGTRSPLLKDKKVLLIENDEVNQMLIGNMLDSLGASYHIETEPQQVLDTLASLRPDLILLATSIDGVNALAFTQQLRDTMKVQVPVIGITAHDLRGRGIYHGLDAIWEKPVEIGALRSLIARLNP